MKLKAARPCRKTERRGTFANFAVDVGPSMAAQIAEKKSEWLTTARFTLSSLFSARGAVLVGVRVLFGYFFKMFFWVFFMVFGSVGAQVSPSGRRPVGQPTERSGGQSVRSSSGSGEAVTVA